jgi:hypothetical protein
VPRSQAQIDVCRLLTKEEIEAIQGSPIKETKSSVPSDAGFHVSQCFYTAAEFSRSVSLTVTLRGLNQPTGRTVREFWQETFGRFDNQKKESNPARSEEEKRESVPPKKIPGIGDEAFWVKNRFGGILYVLKGDAFISISLGGSDDEETTLKKSKALAEKALQRL